MINIQDNIAEMSVGNISIGSAYVGNQLVWEKSSPILPYDAEVEWLYSSGNGQYIDTGIVYDSTVELEGKMQLSGSATGNYMFGIYTKVNNVAQRWGLNVYSTTRVAPHFGTITNVYANFSRNVFHIVTADYRYLKVDNTTTNTKAAAFTPEQDVNIYLFARSNNNTPTTHRACYIGYLKMWKNSVLVRDYIPVRVGTTGYMYDKVSQTLFGNAGTGAFTYGNDVTQ
jgi:hypothetical protein